MATKKVAASLDMLLNELKNVKIDSLSSAPATATAGRMYFNTGDNTLYYGANGKWNPIATGGSVNDALKSLKLYYYSKDGETYNMYLYTGENPTGDNLFGGVDVTDFLKNSSVASIVSFLPSEGVKPSDGRVGGIYNEDKDTFTTQSGVAFENVAYNNHVYLGLILDNYGSKFKNLSDRYVGLAIDTNLVNGINSVVADNEVVHLKNPGTLKFGSTDEVKVATPANSSSNDIEVTVQKISAEKIVHRDWTPDASETTITPADTYQNEINEDLRDKINGTRNIFDELSLKIFSDGKMYFTYDDGDKINENGFDVSDFLKDGMLLTVTQTFTATEATQSVTAKDGKSYSFTGLKVGTPYIGFVWETREGTTQTVALDVTDLFNAYKSGSGLSLDGDTFSVKIDSSGDSFLSVSGSGVKLTGVKVAIEDLSNSLGVLAKTVEDHTNSLYTTTVPALSTAVTRIENQRSKYKEVPAGTSSVSITEEGYEIRNIRFYQLSDVDGMYDEIEVSVLKTGKSRQDDQQATVSWSGISVTAAKPAFITYEVVPMNL